MRLEFSKQCTAGDLFLFVFAVVVFLFMAQTAQAIDCAAGMQVAPANVVGFNSQLSGKCMTTAEITKYEAAVNAIKDLSGSVCPEYSVGFPSGVDPDTASRAQYNSIKETVVYFTAGKYSMNQQFLQCADAFIKKAKRAGLRPCITAALRTPGAQQASAADSRNKVVCGRSGSVSNCPHVKGIAIDLKELSVPTRQVALQSLGNSALGLKMNIPNDPWHLYSDGSGTCGVGNAVPYTPSPGGTYAAPSSAITSALRSLLSPAPSYYPLPPSYQQPLPQTQQPFDYTQTQPAQTSASSPNTSGGVSGGTSGCLNGSGSNQLNSKPGASSPAGNSINTLAQTSVSSYLYANQNTNENATTSSNGLSALEMIQQLAGYPTSTNGAPATGTSGPATLNENVQNVPNNTQSNQNVVATRTIATMSTSVPAFIPAQTFTSSDLRNSNPVSTYSAEQTSTFRRILTQLRDVLIRILKYLQPFGGTVRR